jgi:hypothetical protein
MKVFVGDRKNIPERNLPGNNHTRKTIRGKITTGGGKKISPQFCTEKASCKNNPGYQVTEKISFPPQFLTEKAPRNNLPGWRKISRTPKRVKLSL